jgi:SAM-dependent methyltransferase
MLDFGAGSGGLVHGLRAIGVETDGVEPSATGRELARSLFDVDLIPSLELCSHRRYGAVTLLHVLEHVPDPRAELKALGAVMTPSGIVFIEVPHAGSAGMWLPSRRRAILDPPAHLHHFTPRTLRALLENAGYEVLDVQLFNVAPVERLLAWRAVGREAPGAVGGAGVDAVTRSRTTSTRSARAAWAKVLEVLRTLLQGPKFQVIAKPARPPS